MQMEKAYTIYDHIYIYIHIRFLILLPRFGGTLWEDLNQLTSVFCLRFYKFLPGTELNYVWRIPRQRTCICRHVGHRPSVHPCWCTQLVVPTAQGLEHMHVMHVHVTTCHHVRNIFGIQGWMICDTMWYPTHCSQALELLAPICWLKPQCKRCQGNWVTAEFTKSSLQVPERPRSHCWQLAKLVAFPGSHVSQIFSSQMARSGDPLHHFLALKLSKSPFSTLHMQLYSKHACM